MVYKTPGGGAGEEADGALVLPCVEQPTALRLDRRVCPRVNLSDNKVRTERQQLLVQPERLLARDFPSRWRFPAPAPARDERRGASPIQPATSSKTGSARSRPPATAFSHSATRIGQELLLT